MAKILVNAGRPFGVGLIVRIITYNSDEKVGNR